MQKRFIAFAILLCGVGVGIGTFATASASGVIDKRDKPFDVTLHLTAYIRIRAMG